MNNNYVNKLTISYITFYFKYTFIWYVNTKKKLETQLTFTSLCKNN